MELRNVQPENKDIRCRLTRQMMSFKGNNPTWTRFKSENLFSENHPATPDAFRPTYVYKHPNCRMYCNLCVLNTYHLAPWTEKNTSFKKTVRLALARTRNEPCLEMFPHIRVRLWRIMSGIPPLENRFILNIAIVKTAQQYKRVGFVQTANVHSGYSKIVEESRQTHVPIREKNIALLAYVIVLSGFSRKKTTHNLGVKYQSQTMPSQIFVLNNPV